MARLRQLGSEFTHPDEFRESAILNMPYLTDMVRYQDYLDGRLETLFRYYSASGNTTFTDNTQTTTAATTELNHITGMDYYLKAGWKSLVEVNFFKSVARYRRSAVLQETPSPIGADDAERDKWIVDSRPIIKELRRGLDWHTSKGRAVFGIERKSSRGSTYNIFRAIDPLGYIPIVSRFNRDLVLGHALLFWWRAGPRLPNTDLADRVDIVIIVDEDGVDLSDGDITEPVNEMRTFGWSGDAGTGITLLNIEGAGVVSPSKFERVFTFGTDDSIFGSMESNAFDANMSLSHSRLAITQDIRSFKILPPVTGSLNVDATGKFTYERLNPVIELNAALAESGAAALGYVEPVGMNVAQAHMDRYDMALRNMAYTADQPPESVGQDIGGEMSGVALDILREVFITDIIDIRDEIAYILNESLPYLGFNTDKKVGWQNPPFVKRGDNYEMWLALYEAGLVSQETAQGELGVPVETVERPDTGNNMMANNMNQLSGSQQNNDAQVSDNGDE